MFGEVVDCFGVKGVLLFWMILLKLGVVVFMLGNFLNGFVCVNGDF